MQQPGVDLADAVQPRGTDGSPYDAGREVHSPLRTGVAVGLVCLADVVDVVEHPEDYGVLRQRTDDTRRQLRGEQRPPRDLHVQAQLHVRGEDHGLAEAGVGVELEDEHDDGFAWDEVAGDDLAEDRQHVAVEVGDGEHAAGGNEVEQCQSEGDHHAPGGHLRVVYLLHHDGEAENHSAQKSIPPPGNVLVPLNHAGVNVLLAARVKGANNLPPVVEEDVRGHAAHDGEGDAVAQSEGDGHEDGAVLAVLVHQEVAVLVDDARGVVDAARVVVRVGSGEGEVRRVPGVGVVQDGRDDGEDDDPACKDICLSPEGDHQRGAVVSYLGPVEGDREIGQPGGHAEEIIDDFVVYLGC